MTVNTYRGVVNDRPLDTMVVRNREKPFMDNVLAQANRHGEIPMRAVENSYDKGQ